MADQFGDAKGDDPRFASARAGQDEQRAGERLYGFFLRRVKAHAMDGKGGTESGKGATARLTPLPWRLYT